MSAVGQWLHEMQEDAEWLLVRYPDSPDLALMQFLKLHPGQTQVFENCRREWDGDGFQCPALECQK